MSVSVITGYTVKSRNPLDAKLGPYSSIAEANSNIPEEYRFVGLKVVIVTNAVVNDDGDFIDGIANTYWYSGGVQDTDLKFYGGMPDGDLIVNGTVTATNFILTGSGNSNGGSGGGGGGDWFLQANGENTVTIGQNTTVNFIGQGDVTVSKPVGSTDVTISASFPETSKITETIYLDVGQTVVNLTNAYTDFTTIMIFGNQVDTHALIKDIDFTVSGNTITLSESYPDDSGIYVVTLTNLAIGGTGAGINGLKLRSDNGTEFILKVNNDGSLTTEQI